VRRQLVDEHVLALLEGDTHALLLHLIRLGDEGLDDEEDDEGQDQRFCYLDQASEGTSAHKTGSIGAGTGLTGV
jgi:hypothetical protein